MITVKTCASSHTRRVRVHVHRKRVAQHSALLTLTRSLSLALDVDPRYDCNMLRIRATRRSADKCQIGRTRVVVQLMMRCGDTLKIAASKTRARVYIVKALVAPSVVVRVERARPNNYGFINRVIEHALLFSSRWCCVRMERVGTLSHVRTCVRSQHQVLRDLALCLNTIKWLMQLYVIWRCVVFCVYFLGYDKRINMYCLWFQIMQ